MAIESEYGCITHSAPVCPVGNPIAYGTAGDSADAVRLASHGPGPKVRSEGRTTPTMLKPVVAIYDHAMRGMEDAGLGAWRRDLLAPLEGSVLEIGAGTGSNLPFYPPAVSSLVLSEPDRHMRARLLAATAVSDRPVEVISAPAEHLPFPDDSFDAVISALVLCSVRDQAIVLEEIKRVLRPNGRFVFIEHVAATGSPRRLRQQRWIEPVWKRLAGNCHLTRSTEGAIETAGFVFESIERQGLPKAPPMVRPSIRGRARVAENRSRTDT